MGKSRIYWKGILLCLKHTFSLCQDTQWMFLQLAPPRTTVAAQGLYCIVLSSCWPAELQPRAAAQTAC